MAEYAAFRGIKCPTLFCVTDNHISISLKGHGWLTQGFIKARSMPVFEAQVRSRANRPCPWRVPAACSVPGASTS